MKRTESTILRRLPELSWRRRTYDVREGSESRHHGTPTIRAAGDRERKFQRVSFRSACANHIAGVCESDHRPDCKQVCIGLVVTREGYPLGYEIFPGNKHDSSTLQQIVKRMEQRYGSAERIWVVDRGMVSEANLKWLQERKSRYIVGTPKCQLKRFDARL